MKIVPKDKFDDEACDNLLAASDAEVIPYIEPLLECLQDLNWPIAAPVSERLSVLGVELVAPIVKVLSGTDEVWKYWIISHLLHHVKAEVYQALLFKLKAIKTTPTKAERDEEVHDAVCDLLRTRGTSHFFY